jgi:hypothetical protein
MLILVISTYWFSLCKFLWLKVASAPIQAGKFPDSLTIVVGAVLFGSNELTVSGAS